MVPDDVVGLAEGGLRRSGHQLVQRGHEFADLDVRAHPGNAIIAAGDDALELAVGRAVLRHRDGGKAVPGLQGQHVRQGVVRRQVGGRYHEAGLVALDPADHGGFILDALRAVDKRNSALLGQRNGQLIIRNGLHDGGDDRDVQLNRRFFLAFAVLGQGSLQADVLRDAILPRIPWDQQIFVEGVTGLLVIIGHSDASLSLD